MASTGAIRAGRAFVELFADDKKFVRGLGGATTWGWGTRPRHTIRKPFPSLDTGDYWELCRLCCRDDLPRNTESEFLAGCVRWFKRHQPERVLFFTWADGIQGDVLGAHTQVDIKLKSLGICDRIEVNFSQVVVSIKTHRPFR